MDWFEKEDLRLEAFTSMLCFGGSGCGKTFESVNIMLNRDKVYNKEHEKAVVFYQYDQDAFKRLKEADDAVIFVDNKEDFIKELDESSSTLAIIDDYLTNSLEAENNKFITRLFLEWVHHKATSLIFQSQLLYPRTGNSWTVNCSHMMIFKSHHEAQVSMFFRNLGSDSKFLFERYKDCTSVPFGYLFISFHPKTREYLRVRNSVIPREGVKIYTNNNYNDSARFIEF